MRRHPFEHATTRGRFANKAGLENIVGNNNLRRIPMDASAPNHEEAAMPIKSFHSNRRARILRNRKTAEEEVECNLHASDEAAVDAGLLECPRGYYCAESEDDTVATGHCVPILRDSGFAWFDEHESNRTRSNFSKVYAENTTDAAAAQDEFMYYECPPTEFYDCPETIDDPYVDFGLYCTAPYACSCEGPYLLDFFGGYVECIAPKSCAKFQADGVSGAFGSGTNLRLNCDAPGACDGASVSMAVVDCANSEVADACNGISVSSSLIRCDNGSCKGGTMTESDLKCFECDGVTAIGGYVKCNRDFRDVPCAGLLAYQSYVYNYREEATLVCNSNPDVPEEFFRDEYDSFCDQQFYASEGYQFCKVCFQGDSCRNDRDTPGTVGVCSTEQIDAACDLVCERGYDDVADVVFYNEETMETYFPCASVCKKGKSSGKKSSSNDEHTCNDGGKKGSAATGGKKGMMSPSPGSIRK
ncbi:MAG: hypothetical protein SGILL_009537 [Bacillariaceae sp.]